VPYARLSARHVKLCIVYGCIGNYSIPTANGEVEGVDMLAGAGILNFINGYIQQTPIITPHSVDNSWVWC
jgi:hypothetical protein